MYFLFLKNLVRLFKWVFNSVASIQIYVVIQQRPLLCSEYCYLVSGEGDGYIWNNRNSYVTLEEYLETIVFPGEGAFQVCCEY